MNKTKIIYKLNDGRTLFFNREHMNAHKDVIPFIKIAFSKAILTEEKIQKITIDFGQTIGKTSCVKIDENDHIIYEKRDGRKWPSKFVLNKEPIDSSSVCLVIKRTKYDNVYRLITAYIGTASEREEFDLNVTDPDEKQRIIDFWSTRALVYPKKV